MMKLIIGNKNYSTWSLRPWLLLTHFEVPFDEVQESLRNEGLKERLGQYSPTSRVPVLIDDDVVVWDSLAICEYVSEAYLRRKGWPRSPALRARARAVSAEMHSGFNALRSELPMNLRARRRVDMSRQARDDVRRVDQIWSAAGKPWLFGEFSIADCMFAPVALRFVTYDVELSDEAERYAAVIRDDDNVRRWIEAARQEVEVIEEDEAGEPV